ncbi:phosphoglucosamine mutase [Opitutaceae bacterium EW11]|nr:phosphoglucosamine mutase [Opitutaceae bacterium EW11]
MSRKYFGTDGVRGPYGGPVINENFAERLGVAAGRFASRMNHDGVGRVVLGRDTRASGASLLNAVASGLASVGFECSLLGVLPTPAVAAAVTREKAVLGVMVTASHNPAGDNGIKFFGPNGVKLNDSQEEEIEGLLPDTTPTVISRSTRTSEAIEPYLEKVGRLLPPQSLIGWKVVLDTANGATCPTSPALLRRLGAEVIGIGNSPDGQNINAGVGSEHPEKLSARVVVERARLGIAHDGDGDRCILCDEHGAVLDGDEVLTLLALDALERGSLAQKTLVITVQSNLGVDAAVRAAGGRVLRTSVGDRYVIEGMRSCGANLGGESSGHVICSDYSPTGDGLVAALSVISVMLRTGKPLSELRRCLRKFPQQTLNLRVREKRELSKLPHLPTAIQALERDLGERGRVLVRYSGTEAKLRLLVEGPSEEIVSRGIARLESVARTDLDVV